jgi:hypothetical protein
MGTVPLKRYVGKPWQHNKGMDGCHNLQQLMHLAVAYPCCNRLHCQHYIMGIAPTTLVKGVRTGLCMCCSNVASCISSPLCCRCLAAKARGICHLQAHGLVPACCLQVVLNEVVVDRGISPFLTNLECYCDGNFVTHVQVRFPGRLFILMDCDADVPVIQ